MTDAQARWQSFLDSATGGDQAMQRLMQTIAAESLLTACRAAGAPSDAEAQP